MTEASPAPDADDAPLPAEFQAQAPKSTGGPAPGWPHRGLYQNVWKALYTLPEEFTSSIVIRDFRATDIFTLNSALGASIEDSVVSGLNKLRELWDPTGEYALYRFERQSQAFPDVRLVTDAEGLPSPLLGIELKGWFAVAKESKPTFRYNVNAGACAAQDLIVVFPWVLSDVVAGSPKLLRPYVGEAKHAALYRNFYWTTMRVREGKNPGITEAEHREPYPASKIDKCSDSGQDDSGDNFGRLARSGLLDEFVLHTSKQTVSGIPVKAWVKFFRVFSDSNTDVDTMTDMVERAMRSYVVESDDDRNALIAAMELVLDKLKNAPLVSARPAGRRR
jgi:hypothetical protein